MKSVPVILTLAFLCVILAPVGMMYQPLPEMICSADQCCAEEESGACAAEDTDCCPPGMCNPAQCAFCCFACPVTQNKIVIKAYDTGIKTISEAGNFLLSEFTSECWQPPEFA